MKPMHIVAAWAAACLLLSGCNSDTIQTDAKNITAFTIMKPAATGSIDEQGKQITVLVPYGINKNGLVGTFKANGVSVTVGDTPQASGVTANDFTQPVTYTVTASDGSRADYTVTLKDAVRELFVANTDSDVISVFAVDQPGDAPPIRQFGSMTGLNKPSAVAVDPARGEIFVANARSHSIVVYDGSTSGNAAPVRIIAGPNTGLNVPRGLAIDPTQGLLFVANSGDSSVLAFRVSDSGNARPARRITSVMAPWGGALWSNPSSLAIAPSHNLLFVLADVIRDPVILEFDVTLDGALQPIRRIHGAKTRLSKPSSVALDPVHGEVFVAGELGVTVHAFFDDGDIAPLRRITRLSGLAGVAIDTANDMLVFVTSGRIGSLFRDYSGDAPRIQDSGTPWPSDATPLSLTLDATHGQLLVTAGSENALYIYKYGAEGYSFAREVSAAPSGIRRPVAIAVNALDDEVFVVNSNHSISVYPRNAAGNVTPLRTISGDLTGMSLANKALGNVPPHRIALDEAHRVIYISNQFSLTSYAMAATGNVAPLATILFPNKIGGPVYTNELIRGMSMVSSRGELMVLTHEQHCEQFDWNAYPLSAGRWCTESDLLKVWSLNDGTLLRTTSVCGPSFPLDGFDAVDNETYLSGGSDGRPAVCVCDGSTRIRRIRGDYIHLDKPIHIAVDHVHDDLYVLDRSGWVNVYPRTVDGDVAPLKVITGRNGDLSGPAAIALW